MNKITCDPDTVYRACPNCHCFIFANIHENGTCPKCEKPYKVKFLLSKIKLVSLCDQRNYESEILSYIQNVDKTYSREIMKTLHITEGTVYSIVSRLKNKNIIKVTPYGNKRMIELV